ncbi:MAG: response regulator [Acidobacteria bacterium]|nr:response regulator [Acidobacteriota bacterium]
MKMPVLAVPPAPLETTNCEIAAPAGPFTSLDELQAAHGRLLAALNHEIRTPLTGVLGMADLLLETSLSTEQRDYVLSTRLCAETLLESLSNALEYAAVTGGKLQLSESAFQLHEVIRAAVAAMLARAEAKGVLLHTIFESTDLPAPDVVVGDAIRLRQVVSILVSHAVKTCLRDEVAVAVSTFLVEAEHKLMVTISVGDNGPDLPPSLLNALFDPPEMGRYSQANLELGLPLASQLVRAMGGELNAESIRGCGTIFTVTLAMRVPSESTSDPGVSNSNGRASAGFNILLVEDNDIAQRFMRTVLERKGYRVRIAGSGHAALKAVNDERFDLVIMDVQMPEMDGLEATRRLRSLPAGQHVPIIACTANTSAEVRTSCAELGMDDFLAKPVHTAELVEVVAKHALRRGRSQSGACDN